MQSGKHHPFISRESVQAALNTLLYTSPPPHPNPLERLLLIDELLADPDLPPIARAREWAVQHILTALITQGLSDYRNLFNLSPPDEKEAFEEALRAIATDAQAGGRTLTGWSWLYYRYVRVDLGISQDAFSQAAHLDPRTLRRYQRTAVHQLTERLIAEEWNARVRQRKRRLYNELPSVSPTALIGRDMAIQRVQHLLSNHPPYHVLISGPPGVGKSALVQEVLRQRIDAGEIDELIWINHPPSTRFVREHLAERLLPNGTSFDIRDYMAEYHIAVVLDDIEALAADDTHALDALLEFLSGAVVCLVNPAYVPLNNVKGYIFLTELPERAALELAHRELKLCHIMGNGVSLDEMAVAIREQVGGNPLAIKMAVRNLPIYDLDTAGQHALDQLFARVQSILDERLQRGWFALALFPQVGVSLEKLQAIWPDLMGIDDAAVLLRHYLVERGPEPMSFMLPTAARRYIQQQYRQNPQARAIIDELMSQIDGTSPDSFEVIEYTLLTGWPEVEVARRRQYAAAQWREGLRRGHRPQWREILQRHIDLSEPGDAAIELLIAYGVCLRSLSDWSAAREALQKAIWIAGQCGLFAMQANAMLELAILARYQGNYQEASTLVSRAESIVAHQPDDGAAMMREVLRLERAQIAIDRHDGLTAQRLLADLSETGHTLALRSEAYLLSGDARRALDTAVRAMATLEGNASAVGRMHGTIGRCYEQLGMFEAARRHLMTAITILEQQSDPFALARAQSNLGALMIRSGFHDEARHLLEAAERIQTRLGDRVGLAATQHNLQLLRNG